MRFINLSCPKCNTPIFQDSYQESSNVACGKCRYSFDWKKRWDEELKNWGKKFLLSGNVKEIRLPRNVYVDGVHVGQISNDPFDNLVRDREGYIQGKMTSSGHFASHWW